MYGLVWSSVCCILFYSGYSLVSFQAGQVTLYLFLNLFSPFLILLFSFIYLFCFYVSEVYHFAASLKQFRPSTKLRASYTIMHALLVVVTLACFIPAFLVDDNETYIEAGTYGIASIVIVAASLFLVYGGLLYSRLSKIGQGLKSSKKQMKLALRVLSITLFFAVFLTVSAAMWLLSVIAVDTYLDNFTIFNSVFLGAEVASLASVLFLYSANIITAKKESVRHSSTNRSRGNQTHRRNNTAEGGTSNVNTTGETNQEIELTEIAPEN